jgi:hypothetical protein
MAEQLGFPVTFESDEQGLFLKLPTGWLIEPPDSDVLISLCEETGVYIVKPILDEHGVPNCKFLLPPSEFA